MNRSERHGVSCQIMHIMRGIADGGVVERIVLEMQKISCIFRSMSGQLRTVR